MRLMDVVTTYLYKKLDTIFKRVSEGLKIAKIGAHSTSNMYLIKL